MIRIDASKKAGLEMNLKKTKNMLMPRYHKAGQRHSIKITNGSSEGFEEYKYLWNYINRSKLHT
jgi:hypothetical protein